MKYGLIGEKLTHSYSPYIHNELSNNNYVLMEIKKEDLHDFMMKKDFLSINVTIPYKEEVIEYLDFIDENAKIIGAVNTIVNKDNKLYGYNTDYYGLIDLINENKIDIKNKKVLILGTGGTSKTAYAVCKYFNAKSIIKASRNKSEEGILLYNEVHEKYNDAEMIINTTPVGMFSENDTTNIEKSPIDIDKFNNLEAVIDIIYNPLNTILLYDANNKNIKTANGLYMLVAQAVEADKLFFDKKIDDKDIINTTNSIYKKLLNEIRNIVLIGMPGSGKTKVGNKLSEKLKKELYDLDVVFKDKYHMLPGEYIEKYGEDSFRDKESEIVDTISRKKNVVISTGGGVVLREKNIMSLKRNGAVIFIDRNIDNIKPTTTRPLTNDREKLKSVYEKRLPLYNKYADYVIKSNEVIDDTVDKIIKLFDD